MCMCACACVCVYFVCVSVYVYIYVCVCSACVCVCECVCVCMCVCVRACVCVQSNSMLIFRLCLLTLLSECALCCRYSSVLWLSSSGIRWPSCSMTESHRDTMTAADFSACACVYTVFYGLQGASYYKAHPRHLRKKQTKNIQKAQQIIRRT